MINWPDSPAPGDEFTSGALTWRWTGTKWVAATPATSGGGLTIVSLTDDYTVSAADDGTHFNNAGATFDLVVNLPEPVAGLHYSFVIMTAHYIWISATIVQGGLTGSYIRSNTPGCYLSLEAHDSSGWVVSSTEGGWSLGV